MIFRWMVYAKDEARFFNAWTQLCEEFKDQDDILQYLYHQYLPVYKQWAECAIRNYLNYGQTTTSQSESSNHCIKTYLVSGKCDFYGLIQALREGPQPQEELQAACGTGSLLSGTSTSRRSISAI
jgi:hypothetical protein